MSRLTCSIHKNSVQNCLRKTGIKVYLVLLWVCLFYAKQVKTTLTFGVYWNLPMSKKSLFILMEMKVVFWLRLGHYSHNLWLCIWQPVITMIWVALLVLCPEYSHWNGTFSLFACDSSTCPVEWFYLDCLGLSFAPEGECICPFCTGL